MHQDASKHQPPPSSGRGARLNKQLRLSGWFPLALLFLLLGATSSQAQPMARIDPVNTLFVNGAPFDPPAITTGTTPRDDDRAQAASETTDAVFNVRIENPAANTRYVVTVVTVDNTAFGDVPNKDTTYPNLPNDYIIKTQDFVFTDGNTQTFTVDVLDELDFELANPVTANQNFSARISAVSAQPTADGGAAGGITTNTAFDGVTHFIIDNDVRPDIFVTPISLDAFSASGTNAFAEGGVDANGTAVTSTASVNVRLSARNEVEDINFNYSFSSGTGQVPNFPTATAATSGTDFQNTPGQAVFRRGALIPVNPANLNATPVALAILGDIEDETDEDVLITLSNANTARQNTVTGELLIVDDDGPSVSINDQRVIESDSGLGTNSTTATFTVTLNRRSPQTVNIFFDANPNGAVGPGIDPAEEVATTNRGRDYVENIGTLTFAPNETSKTITVQIIGDTTDENDETFVVDLSAAQNTRGLVFTDAQGLGTIVDDDSPNFVIDDPTPIFEPATGQTTLNFPVRLLAASERTLSIQATAVDNTATRGTTTTGDYEVDPQTQTLTFDPGSPNDPTDPPILQQIFQVQVNADNIDEINETFFVNLANPTADGVTASAADVIISDAQAVGTILDEDGPQVSISDVTMAEGNSGTTAFNFTLTLTAASPQPVTVTYITQDGGGAAGTGTATSTGISPDFTPVSSSPASTITFAPGQTTKTITINVNGDTTFENSGAAEAFQVILTNAVNANTNTNAANGAVGPFGGGADGTPSIGIGTIQNDDALPVITVADIQVTEGSGALFTIRLSNPSDRSITVNFTATGGTATSGVDFTATSGTVTFNAASLNAAASTVQTVTVPTIQDATDEPNEQFTLDLSLNANSTGAATFSPAPGAPADTQSVGTIVDNNAQTVALTGPAAAVAENSANAALTFTLTATSAATGAANAQDLTFTYTVGGTATAGSDFTAPTGTVTIPAGQRTATIVIPVLDNAVAENSETVVITLTPTDPTRVTLTNNTATGTITDDDVSGITVTPANITTSEAGGTATITVSLTSQPTANVTIPVSSTDTSEGTVSTSALTFTPATFATARTITVTGVDDALADGSIGYTIVLGAAQSADTFYAGRKPNDVAATNTDNDVAALALAITSANVIEGGTTTATITRNTENNSQPLTVTLASSNPTVTVPTTVTIAAGAASATFTVTATDDSVVNGARTSNITASTTGFTNSNAVSVAVSDNDSAGIVVTPTTLATNESGTSATFTVRLTSAPTAPVTISFASSNTAEVTVAPTSVTFTAQNFATPQAITVTGVNDDVPAADGAQTAIIRGTSASSDAGYNGLAVASVTVTNADNDTAGLSVSPVSGLQTDETGRSATFSVALNTVPTSNVTIPVASSDTTEGVVTPNVLTFTPQDRGPKTVTVTGVDDLLADGSVAYTIRLGAAASDDRLYAGLDPADVAVSNADNDTANIVVSTRALTTSEAGGSDTFTVNLTSQPSANVTITATSSDTSEGTVEPATLTFTPANYATPQTVRVTGVDDALVDGSIGYSITLRSASADTAYNNVALPIIAATNVDNDTANVAITTSGIRVSEAGTTASFAVRLVGQPSASVTFPITVSKPGEAKLSTSSIVFTPESSGTPKSITVTGLDDFIADGNQTFTITLGPSVSSDPAFNRLRPPALTGINLDNDRSGVRLSQLQVALNEGQTSFVTVTLLSQPTAAVTVSFESGNTRELLTPQPVVLNASNYRTGVRVPLVGVRDNVVDGTVPVLLLVRSLRSTDATYNVSNVRFTGVNVRVNNIDVGSVRISRTVLNLNEGASGTFQVSLGARPSTAVRVLLRSSNAAVGRVSPSTLIFTPTNFNVPQTVTVSSINNNVQSGDTVFTIITTVSAPANGYNGVTGSVVTVTSVDDDDATAPVVTLETPDKEAVFQSLAAITGAVSDDGAVVSGVARVEITLARLSASGVPISYLQNSGVFSVALATRSVAVTADGRFALSLPTLVVGRYRATAVAVDRRGNRSVADVSNFTITDAPTTIAITSPLASGAANPRSIITGTVTTRNSITSSGVLITISLGARVVRTFRVQPVRGVFTSPAIGSLAQGIYTITATATDAVGNVVTDRVTVLVDATTPTVAITSPTQGQVVDNLFEVRGTASDGTNGSGLASVDLLIRRRTDDFYFNGTTFQRAEARVRTRLTGNTWVYNLPSGLPADPDPLNALYSLQAVATDRAGNSRASAAINVPLSTNGSVGSGTDGIPVATSNPSVSAASVAPVRSTLRLSTIVASGDQVTLTFSGALDSTSADDVARYEITIAGQLVKLEDARASGDRVVLSLPAGEAGAGDAISVAYDLRDSVGRTLQGEASTSVR